MSVTLSFMQDKDPADRYKQGAKRSWAWLTNRQQPHEGAPGSLGQREGSTGGGGAADGNQPSPPTISLPKGGDAIRGMGEKIAANPVTGTGSLSVPIYTSPGRSDFGPQLSLSYDSGAGNGLFGWGWSLSVPSITCKTDKGLPKYEDAEESLVPVLKDVDGHWERRLVPQDRGRRVRHSSLPSSRRRPLRPHRTLDPPARWRDAHWLYVWSLEQEKIPAFAGGLGARSAGLEPATF